MDEWKKIVENFEESNSAFSLTSEKETDENDGFWEYL